MATAKFVGKDRHWADGTTTYWFVIARMVGGALIQEGFGIVEGEDGGVNVVDNDGMPLDCNEYKRRYVIGLCLITDEMRAAKNLARGIA